MKQFWQTLSGMQASDRKLVASISAVSVAIVGLAIAFMLTNGFGSGTPPESMVEQLAKNPKTAAVAIVAGASNGTYDATCTYEKPDSPDSRGRFYISHGATRFETETSDGIVYVLRTGTAMYIWNNQSNEGLAYDLGTSTENAAESLSQYDTNEFAKNAEQNNLQCQKVERLDDSLFTPPSDIAFVGIAAS